MSTPRKPNILLLMTDQQRWDSLGCYGHPVVSTPNLDAIAADGTRFTAAYSSTPSCIPARASLMTGLDPWNTGILGMGQGQPPCANLTATLPQQLAAAGYHTQGVGKMHFHPQRSLQGFHHTVLDESMRVIDPGFASDYARWFDRNKTAEYDRYDDGIEANSWVARPFQFPEYLHATNWTAAESVRFLQRRDPTRPFFLKTSFARPHSPYDPPAYYFDMYADAELPPVAVGDWAAVHDVPSAAADVNAWHGRLDRADIQRARAGYLGSVTHIDHQIGRIVRELRMRGEYEDTVIVFTSDHGDMLGDHHLWRKTYAYEGSAHVPLLIRLPRWLQSEVGQEVDAPVCLQDLMPTLLELAGADCPPVDGRSLVGPMTGDATGWRDAVHGEHNGCYSLDQEMQYLTDGRWKYIWFTRTGKEQLFDLAADPYECTDLAALGTHAEGLEEWRRRLVSVLEPRACGLTQGGQLTPLTGDEPLLSPNARARTRAAEVVDTL